MPIDPHSEYREDHSPSVIIPEVDTTVARTEVEHAGEDLAVVQQRLAEKEFAANRIQAKASVLSEGPLHRELPSRGLRRLATVGSFSDTQWKYLLAPRDKASRADKMGLRRHSRKISSIGRPSEFSWLSS
jgi:hypothetical protein